MSDKLKLKEAQKLINSEQFNESINILLTILDDKYPKKAIEIKYLMLSGCYLQTKNYNQSILCSEKVLKINNSNELASLNKYLAHVYIKDYNSAFYEIFNFLKSNPANLYKDTLKELLYDINTGAINDDDIIAAIKFLAIKNEVIKA